MRITINSATFYNEESKDFVKASLSIYFNEGRVEEKTLSTEITIPAENYCSNGNFTPDILERIEAFSEKLESEKKIDQELKAKREKQIARQIEAEKKANEEKELANKLAFEQAVLDVIKRNSTI